MSLVVIDRISKTFGKRPALEPLSLEIAEGEIFGLLGHNGAGKSTTFGIMLGHISTDSGSVRIGGHDVRTDRAKALYRTGAIFETPCFYDYLTGGANLDYFVSLAGTAGVERRKKVVEFVGLQDRLQHKLSTYSHGMRQRLALAQALLPDPDFILLDEPNDGLDPQGIIETREMINRLRSEQGKTIMFSSHILSEVEQLCDRIAILHQGRLVFCGRWQEAVGTDIRLVAIFRKPELAMPVMERAGLIQHDGGSLFVLPGKTDLATLSTTLAAAGAGLEEFRVEKASLEDFYLGKLREEKS